jgi:phosphatidyl-myo-inositol alpha-mannosyltransferase
MKICLVSPYDFAREGGVNQHILGLAKQFRTLGHTVKIIAPSSEDSAEHIYPDPDVYVVGTVVPIKANGSVARITLSLNLSGQVKQILRKENFDVIHLHEPLMPALPITVLWNSQCVNIGTFHAFAQSHIGYYYARPIFHYLMKKLDGRVAVSSPARDFISQYFKGDYNVIPNGIDLSRFQQASAPIPQLQDGKLNILFVGRFSEPRKGFKFLLRAFVGLKRQMPNVRLVVVGKGNNHGYLRYIERHNIQDVEFVGYVSDEDLPRYHRSSHVFCAPAIGGESFGIVLTEAMASGLPVVASDIPGYASVLEHGKQGLLIEPRNREALTLALMQILSDKDLRQTMSEAGPPKAATYTWEIVCRRLLELYERSATRREAKNRLKRIKRINRSNSTFGKVLQGGKRLTRFGSRSTVSDTLVPKPRRQLLPKLRPRRTGK